MSDSIPDSATASSSDSSSVSVSSSLPVSSSSSIPTYVQLIDHSGRFVPSDDALESLVLRCFPSSSAADSSSTDYSVVSIMGCQSSGKSTLLNALFGTRFPEMDSQAGRSQTTQGIWLDSVPDSGILVMDVEGTDSLERGEDRVTFERQTSLFALAMAELLIINTWEHDVGRYTASNFGILKTIFEVNLQLFNPQSKTVLLFVVRDHIERVTPFKKIQEKIENGITEIWSQLRKPEQFADARVDQLFEFRFAGLSTLPEHPERFASEVAELKLRFLDRSHPACLSPPECRHKKSVPPSGFGSYARSVWSAIASNQELNLPSQRELLATFRCDECIQQQITIFSEARKSIDSEARQALWPDFQSQCRAAFDRAAGAFDRHTRNYEPGIVAKKRSELLKRLAEALEDAFQAQAKFILDVQIKEFQVGLKTELAKESRELDERFYSIVKQLREAREKQFNQELEQRQIAEQPWKVESLQGEWSAAIDHAIGIEKSRQLAAMDRQLEALIQGAITPALSPMLQAGDGSLWSQVAKLYSDILKQAEEFISRKCEAFQCSAAEAQEFVSLAQSKLSSAFRVLIENHRASLLLHMKHRFEQIFHYDEDGVRRHWRADDKVRQHWTSAKDSAMQLLTLFERFRLQEAFKAAQSTESKSEGFSNAPILISAVQRSELESAFLSSASSALRDAEADQERTRQASKIPPWVYLMFFVLGFDELLTILSSPLLLILTIIIGGGLITMWKLGLLKPARKVAEKFIREAIQFILHTIEQANQQRQGQGHGHGQAAEQRPSSAKPKHE